MHLKCVSSYSSGRGSFKKGQELHVSDEEGAFLLRDSPGSFEVVKEKKDPIESTDRMQRGGNRR